MRYGSLVFVLMVGCTTAKKEVGPPGPQGEQGSSGPAGYAGEQGLPGEHGARGQQGSRGLKGERGPRGVQGFQGSVGAAGANGAMGPAGRDGMSCSVEDVEEGARVVCGSDVVVVQHGEDGEQGEIGPPGPQGLRGPVGPVGPQGERGPRGERGPEGEDGSRGERGVAGPLGPEGGRGPAGLPGEMGPIGPYGPQGEQGLQGVSGADGENCAAVRNADDTGVTIICGDILTVVNDGLDGLDGAVGLQGVAGIQGEPGLQGPQGERGEIGSVGPEGSAGAQGPVGPQGPAGRDGRDLVAQCPAGSQELTFNGNLMYCARTLVFNEPQTWVQCLDECLRVGLFLAKEPDIAIICLADPNFFTEGETVGEDVASTPGTCDDGRNNNGDPAVDCDDPACADALNCDVDKRYHFEIVGDFSGVIRMHPLARVDLLGDTVNLCEAVLAFQAGDQLAENEDGSWTRLFMGWSQFEEAVATAFSDADAGLEENANPRRCLCGKRL